MGKYKNAGFSTANASWPLGKRGERGHRSRNLNKERGGVGGFSSEEGLPKAKDDRRKKGLG